MSNPAGDIRALTVGVTEAFIKIARQAERAEADVITSTFVESGHLISSVLKVDNQVIFGRRGTGKTHTLLYAKQIIESKGGLGIFIDCRTIGSDGSIYNDKSLSISERAKRLAIDFSGNLHDELRRFCLLHTIKNDLSAIGPMLDEFAESISRVKLEGEVELELLSSREEVSETGIEGGASLKSVDISMNLASGSLDKESSGQRVITKGHESFVWNFSDVARSLDRILKKLDLRLYVFVDEWSSNPIDIQPFLADFLRRVYFPIPQVSIKIAAIEHRTKLNLIQNGTFIGIEWGGDVQASIRLDDILSFDNAKEKSIEFFEKFLFKHFVSNAPNWMRTRINSPEKLLEIAFTQGNVFLELVRACEGTPRDALNIVELAVLDAGDQPMSLLNVRKAARDWCDRDKIRPLDMEAGKLLTRLVSKVVGERRSRAFLFRKDCNDLVLDRLYDARLIHLARHELISSDTSMMRYRVFRIDYALTLPGASNKSPEIRYLPIRDMHLDVPHLEMTSVDCRIIKAASIDTLELMSDHAFAQAK